MREEISNSETARRALLGLWAVPGVGAKSVEALRQGVGELQTLIDAPVREWLGAVQLPEVARGALSKVERLGPLADQVLDRCQATGTLLAFQGEAGYPERLTEIDEAPPVLFRLGELGPPRRRLAMVGTRRPDSHLHLFLRAFATEIARAGVGVVSGAADGVDQICHKAALQVEGETWAFLGSAIDQMDPSQARLRGPFLEGGGVFFSELPPGVRADKRTFPRRNRLISGASDAVLILRAGADSGALYTANYAGEQGRPLLAMPGDPSASTARGINELLRSGQAKICLDPADALNALGLTKSLSGAPPQPEKVAPASLSKGARAALGSLDRTARPFEELLLICGLSSGELLAALCELELMGLAVQHPGRRYERL